MGYEVEIQALRAAARAAGEAAEAAGRVELGTEIDDIPAALPGGQAGAAATALAGVWARTVRSWSEDAAAYSADVSGAADDYAAAESDAAADFQAVR